MSAVVNEKWPRVIVHADMDAFYAAIEQLDDPALRGRPLLIGPPSARGVVLTASYEARPFGVGSAMPMARARKLCPQALVVPPRFERYQEVSATIMRLFGEFSPCVEPLSLDEAFLDMTGSERLFGSPEQIGAKLKRAVRDATGGLTASVGISATKYVAKVASGHGKPDGLTIVPPADAAAWLAPQPVSNLWGAGPKTTLRLEQLGLRTIGAVAALDPTRLEGELGAVGRRFGDLARGLDPRHVSGARAARGLSSERTLESDVSTRPAIEAYLRSAAETVARRLRRRGERAERRSDQAEGRRLSDRHAATRARRSRATSLRSCTRPACRYSTASSSVGRSDSSGSAPTTSIRRSISRSSRCRSSTDARDASRRRSTESKSASARAPCSVHRSSWRTVA